MWKLKGVKTLIENATRLVVIRGGQGRAGVTGRSWSKGTNTQLQDTDIMCNTVTTASTAV